MSSAVAQDRCFKAAEYLGSMRSLSNDLERAMQAIAQNSLADLEESIGMQHALSNRLVGLAEELSSPLDADPMTSDVRLSDDLLADIESASATLRVLNKRYAALLRHSSRCARQMASLFQTFQGQFQEAPGSGSKHQTWSCQI